MDINTTLIWYVILSVVITSLASIVGASVFLIKREFLDKASIYLVSFAVGALFGDVFIHLLPEAFTESSKGWITGVWVLSGIMVSFTIEKIINWHHCHLPESKHHHHSFVHMNIMGDVMHNLVDGIIISASYFISIPVGIATTTAVFLHEIPHEMGTFGVLIRGGLSKLKAFSINLLSAIAAFVGAGIGIMFSTTESLLMILIPFAAGNLIYIAGTDLIPQLQGTKDQEKRISRSVMQLIAMILGIAVMLTMIFIE